VFYGRRVLLFMKDNGLVIISVVGTLALVALIVYLIVNRRNRRLAAVNGEAAEKAADSSERVAD
jgi:hypothetical protein